MVKGAKPKFEIPTPKVPETNKPIVVGVHKPAGLYNNHSFVPVFSFINANLEGSSLCFNNPLLTSEHYHRLFEKLKLLSDKTYLEMKQGGKYYRFHEVDFTESNVSLTMHNFKTAISKIPEKVKDEDMPTCYQFDVFHKMRAMGYLGYNGIFYLVWFDPNHEIYE